MGWRVRIPDVPGTQDFKEVSKAKTVLAVFVFALMLGAVAEKAWESYQSYIGIGRE
jgi:hypothetical protein